MDNLIMHPHTMLSELFEKYAGKTPPFQFSITAADIDSGKLQHICERICEVVDTSSTAEDTAIFVEVTPPDMQTKVEDISMKMGLYLGNEPGAAGETIPHFFRTFYFSTEMFERFQSLEQYTETPAIEVNP